MKHHGFGLASLIQPLGASRFLNDYWPKKHFVAHGSLDQLRPLHELPELKDLDSLIRCSPSGVRVWSNTPDGITIPHIPIESRFAKELFRSENISLVFHALKENVKGLSALLYRVVRELNTPVRDYESHANYSLRDIGRTCILMIGKCLPSSFRGGSSGRSREI